MLQIQEPKILGVYVAAKTSAPPKPPPAVRSAQVGAQNPAGAAVKVG